MARTGAAPDSPGVKALKLAEKLSIKLADVLITIHEPARRIFLSRNKGIEEKIHVVINSVDPAEFKDAKLLPGDKFVIIYNGTVVKLLNLTMIVEALAKLKTIMAADDFNRLVFRIYGDGPALEDILALAEKLGVKDKVEYMGFLAPPEMRKEVLRANVLILPPLKNIYSDLFYTIKLIESIYLGLPVIATRLNTYKTYYREESLFYFDSGNLDQLVERINEVYYNKELVKEKTQNARADYEMVGWSVMRKKYLDIINPLLK